MGENYATELTRVTRMSDRILSETNSVFMEVTSIKSQIAQLNNRQLQLQFTQKDQFKDLDDRLRKPMSHLTKEV
jgi:hypothetical protein